jgi:pyrroline-5-carboxylate reductase
MVSALDTFTDERPLSVGFIGVGAIAAAIVDALVRGPNANRVDIILSPRSASRSAELAARHQEVRIAAHNHAVVDASQIVVIAVLPDQMADVCGSLTFGAEQVVVSLAAGWPPSLLKERVQPATTVCQMIPLPMISLHSGPIVLYPRVVEVERLMKGCGDIIIPAREQDVIVLNCASAVMSSFFEFQNRIIDWTLRHGVDAQMAKDYVVTLLHGLTAESMKARSDDISELARDHETSGGLNEYLRTSLAEAGVFRDLEYHLDQLLKTRDRSEESQEARQREL